MLQQADFDINDFDRKFKNEADAKLMVKFYIMSIRDPQATKREGRPMFKDVEICDIKVPGQKDGVARPATPHDKNRFPAHYAAFKARVEMPEEGTPLAEWPLITRSLADQLTFMHIKTVEQLATVADSSLHQMQGITGLKQKAHDWLENAKEDGLLVKLRTELAERDAKIEDLANNLEAVMQRLGELEKVDQE